MSICVVRSAFLMGKFAGSLVANWRRSDRGPAMGKRRTLTLIRRNVAVEKCGYYQRCQRQRQAAGAEGCHGYRAEEAGEH